MEDEKYCVVEVNFEEEVLEMLQSLSAELNISIDRIVESAIISQLIREKLKNKNKGE